MASDHPAPADRRASSSADADLAGIVLAREPSVRLGALTIEPPMRRVLHDDGQEEFLEPRVMQALVALVRADGKILTRDDLLAQCWSGVVVGDDSINRVMARLRRLAEGPGAGVFHVETITKVGYRLVVEGPAAPAAVPAVTKRAEPRLAVLAFDNLSGDPEMTYFSDGVSEEIQQTVARAADLKVIGRTSSFHYRGADKDLKRVSAELQATHLLDGAVRRSGGRVRVSAQLIECAGETTLWSDRFDRDLSDVFALQDEIAAAVAVALKVALTPSPKAEPIDPAAYELFLKARDLSAAAFGFDLAAFRTAVDLLEQATSLAPRFARAWAGLAAARANLLRRTENAEPYAVMRAKVVGAAETALRLDPGLWSAHFTLASLEAVGRWTEREALVSRALSAAPNDMAVLYGAVSFYAHVGRHREALDLAKRGVDLDPMNVPMVNQYAILLCGTGRYLEGQAIFERLITAWPDAADIVANALGLTAAHDADRREKLIILAKARGMYHGYVREFAGWSRNLTSKDAQYAAEFLQYSRHDLDRTGSVLEILVSNLCELGLADEAFDLMDRSSFDYVTDPERPWLGASRFWQLFSLVQSDNLIRDPRYPRLCAKLGLCNYWVETGKWPDLADEVPYDFRAECRRLARASGASA